MNLKEIFIGSVVTLIVTVLGGVGVYYWTKEPDEKKNEALYYSISQVAKFKGGEKNVGFNIANIRNQGGVTAKNVVLKIDFPSASITDYSIESASGLKPKSQSIDKQKAVFVFETLVPSDAVTVGLLTTTSETPEISLRSNDSLGKLEDKRAITSAREKVNRFAVYYIPLLGGLAILVLIYLIRIRRRVEIEATQPDPSKNDMGFVLLHQGLFTEAETILDYAILSGEDGAYSLSNLATCRAKNGRIQEARSLISAASFIAQNNHERAVVVFNGALISLFAGDTNDFFAKLKDAAVLSSESIKEYSDYSVHLTALRLDPRYDAVFRSS
ncbi:hypothetical protein ABIE30_000655 [Janthinobacterium lividum]|uniref:tetratricopeptide repeat protein n=1 Tax=Janthinobacterium lividum TaxID=29581 RepID=UPI003D1DAD34